MKLALTVLLMMPLVFGLAVAGDGVFAEKPVPFDGNNIVEGNYQLPSGPPTISNSPGEVIGTSYYAYQTNGSTGNRISIDSEGGIHISFTKGTAEGGRPRYVYYNFKDENTGNWLGETAISSSNGTGFVTMDLLEGGEAMPVYHFADADVSYTGIAVDLFRGFGIFEEIPIPNNGVEWIWPYVARNPTDGIIHVLCSEFGSEPTNYGYTFSTDGGESWDRYRTIFATDILSGIICTSPVSSKTSIIYTLNEGDGIYNVFYFETEDGDNWNWGEPFNITQYAPGDGYSAYADVDGIYDYDDNLHISHQRQPADDEGLYIWGDIMHWSAEAGPSVIGTHPDTDTCSTVNYCLCNSKMSLGVNPENGNLFAIWADASQNDVSLAGFSNGELFAAASVDNGATWFPHVNITNSPTPGCDLGDCDSDYYSSLAEIVDGTLHIMYVDDDDAGAEWRPEGGWTDNNVLYLTVEEGELIPLSVDHDINTPFEFELSQNYPNPFNANTVIDVEGDFESGRLAIYDIAGRLVNNFAIGENNRSITWDGTDLAGDVVASGTYFYSVNVDGFGTASVKKMTLLK